MRKELEARFAARWTTWFNFDGDYRQTLMFFGLDVGDGWFDIVWRLCEDLEPLVIGGALNTEDSLFEVVQVKEKFGGLRFYTNKSDERILHLIAAAEQQSLVTCELCGQPGTTQGKSWIRTRCEAHASMKRVLGDSVDSMLDRIELFDSIANSDDTDNDARCELTKPNQQGQKKTYES